MSKLKNMDIEIPGQERQKQKRRIWIRIGLALVLLAVLLAGFRQLLRSSVKRSEILVATAEKGSIEAAVTASGVVSPQFEQVIATPIEAKIEKVLKNAGEKVKAGEAILLLNREFSILALEKLKDEQAIKRNKTVQLRLSLQKSIDELESQQGIQRLKVESFRSLYDDELQLKNIGGTTEDKLKQAELNLKIATEELALLEKKIANHRAAMTADLKAQELEISIQQKTIEESERKIKQAEIRAEKDGVITWVNGNIGSAVSAGELLARVADLASFKIEGSISDSYAASLQVGGPVLVRASGEDLRGAISNIKPAVENDIIRFTVALDDKSHKALRANLRVDVFVVTSYKNDVIRVKNGPFYNGSADQPVFVVRGGKAVRRLARIGESNFDFVEIVSGINAGEQVIISGMTAYSNMEEVDIKD